MIGWIAFAIFYCTCGALMVRVMRRSIFDDEDSRVEQFIFMVAAFFLWWVGSLIAVRECEDEQHGWESPND